MPEILCPCHGRSNIISSVCGHLVQNRGVVLGFIENSDDPEDKQGWCYACELVYLQEEDKTERFHAFTHHTVVCTQCYDEIKMHHDFECSFASQNVSDGDAQHIKR
ncbi:MAG: hypothetical protein AABZ60_08330 [Planctomycetota bacterium]